MARISAVLFVLLLISSQAFARFTCDRNGFYLNGRPFTPVGASYAIISDLDFSHKYDPKLAEKDLNICKDLHMNTLLVNPSYTGFEPEDNKWNEAYVRNVDDFIDRAYRHGIYIAICNPDWPADYEFAKLPKCEESARSDQRFLQPILAKSRAEWAQNFLIRLRNKHRLFAWVIYGEPATNAWAGEHPPGTSQDFMAGYMKSALMTRWHNYLRERYGSFENLRESWSLGDRIEAIRQEETDFDTVRPAFEGDIQFWSKCDYPHSWRRSEDYQRFLADQYIQEINYINSEVKKAAPGILTCNSLLPVLLPVLRSWQWSAPSANHGIACPERLVEARIKTNFTAIRFSPDMDSWSEGLSGGSVPIEYKNNIALPAAVAYLKHSLDSANKPLMFFDLDNDDFGSWTDAMRREYTSQELPISFFAGSKGYLWWCYKNDKSVNHGYGLVNDDRTPTARYSTVKEFNKWILNNRIKTVEPKVTVIVNETDAIVDPWDTWSSLKAISASLASRDAQFEVITLREFIQNPTTRSRVIWLRNGYADAEPSTPQIRHLMNDPQKEVLVIGVDRFLSSLAGPGDRDVFCDSLSVLPGTPQDFATEDTAYRPRAPFMSIATWGLRSIAKLEFIPEKFGTLTNGGKRLIPGTGLVRAKLKSNMGDSLACVMNDADGSALIIEDVKLPVKKMLLLEPQTLWYSAEEPGALDLIPSCLGLTNADASPGLSIFKSKYAALYFQAFGTPSFSMSGLSFDSEGKLATDNQPLQPGQIRIISLPGRQ